MNTTTLERTGALLLSAADLRSLMTPADYLAAVREAFVQLATGTAAAPAPLHLEAPQGSFHAKAACTGHAPATRVALKFNANFPGNPERHGLPTIQGALLLCDGDDGRLLALLDSTALTIGRTAAATALAAQYLARPDSQALLVCGCGAQAFAQVEALAAVLPLRRVWLYDQRIAAAQSLAVKVRERLELQAEVVAADVELGVAARLADVVVTCTTSREPILHADMVRPGSFIAAVGADNPHKSEIAPALMARATVVVDLLSQCLAMGDLHHAVAASAMRAEQVHAELAELVSGRRRGRARDDEIALFDSTGIGMQDVTSALRAVALAQSRGIGKHWDIGQRSEELAP